MTSLAKVFDPASVLLAKHAQHVVLVHFPIALFITGVALSWVGQWSRREALKGVGYYNLLIAAISTVPVLVTGILAWQFQLEGQRLKGVLLLHLIFGSLSGVLICMVWWMHFRAKQRDQDPAGSLRLLESLAILIVGLTGHLGGFLSGVNGGGPR